LPDYGPLPAVEVKDFDFSMIYTDPVPLIYGHYYTIDVVAPTPSA